LTDGRQVSAYCFRFNVAADENLLPLIANTHRDGPEPEALR
jgi:hypothetical protein